MSKQMEAVMKETTRENQEFMLKAQSMQVDTHTLLLPTYLTTPPPPPPPPPSLSLC